MTKPITFLHLPIHNLVEIPTIKDGSCFFHAVLEATSSKYCAMDTKRRRETAMKLRHDLANSLEKRYHELSRGHLGDFAKTGNMPEYTLDGMVKVLKSNKFAGQEHLELISDFLGIDIYIINMDTSDVYFMGCAELVHKKRPSVILGFQMKAAHYVLIGQMKKDRAVTFFAHDHETIKAIRKRLRSKKSHINTNAS